MMVMFVVAYDPLLSFIFFSSFHTEIRQVQEQHRLLKVYEDTILAISSYCTSYALVFAPAVIYNAYSMQLPVLNKLLNDHHRQLQITEFYMLIQY